MSPRLIAGKRCPHCGAELPEPKPRACPQCMGSLQQRYLQLGCLTTKPMLALVAWGAWQAFGGGAASSSAAGSARCAEERALDPARRPAPVASRPGVAEAPRGPARRSGRSE